MHLVELVEHKCNLQGESGQVSAEQTAYLVKVDEKLLQTNPVLVNYLLALQSTLR